MAAERLIVGMGGFPEPALIDHVLGLARGRRVLYVPTASMERPDGILDVYEAFRGRAEIEHLAFFPWPPSDVRGLALAHDVIFVGGGNTASMLAVWRAHGFDRVLREAWEGGIVLSGWSAGMICWFEAGVTDSFGPQLAGMEDGLGFLGGSACPHYDGEELRRPVYRALVDDGFPAGLAVDDRAAVVFAGGEVVTTDAAARAYRVERGGESPLDARLLG